MEKCKRLNWISFFLDCWKELEAWCSTSSHQNLPLKYGRFWWNLKKIHFVHNCYSSFSISLSLFYVNLSCIVCFIYLYLRSKFAIHNQIFILCFFFKILKTALKKLILWILTYRIKWRSESKYNNVFKGKIPYVLFIFKMFLMNALYQIWCLMYILVSDWVRRDIAMLI